MQKIFRARSVKFVEAGSSTSSEMSLNKSDVRCHSDEMLLTDGSGKQHTLILVSYKFLEEKANDTLLISPKSNLTTNLPTNYASISSTSQSHPTTTVASLKDQQNLSEPKKDAELAMYDKSSAECSDNPKAHDTDGGWAWMVLAAGFLQFVVSSGIFYSWGVFFVPLLEAFGESRARTAWVFSTNAAVHQLAGPLGGFLIPRLGARVSVILAGLLAAAGCTISAFAPSIELLYVSHGIINAVGTSLNFTGWVVGLSHFFVKKRGLALGFAMSGSGWGVLTLGPFLAKFVPVMGWRKAMLMCAGLSLNFIVFGLFIYNNNIGKDDSIKQKKLLSAKTGTSKGNMSANIESLYKGNGADLASNNCKYKQKVLLKEVESVEKPVITSVQDKKKKIEWIGVQMSCVLSIMATSTVYMLLKDWINWIGLGEIISYSLIAAGVGDIIGRIFAGILSWVIAKYNVSVLVLFGGTHVLLAVSLAVASVGETPVVVLCSVVGIGLAGGLQCVFTAVAPMGTNSAKDLGTLLLAGGIGALIGPPIAGFLVDYSGSYSVTLMLCAAAPALGVVTCVVCYVFSQCSSK